MKKNSKHQIPAFAQGLRTDRPNSKQIPITQIINNKKVGKLKFRICLGFRN